MTALTKFACTLVLAGGLATPVFAATTGPGSTSGDQSSMSNGQGSMTSGQGSTSTDQNASTKPAPMRISQKLRDDLSKAGFSDITIMPSSFLVRAKDSQGNAVMMVINPDSVTAITEGTENGNSASNAKHSPGDASNKAGAPGPTSAGGSQPVTPGNASKP